MPIVILKDGKGFKKDMGWMNKPPYEIRFPVVKKNDGFTDSIPTGEIVTYLFFRLLDRNDPDVWIYEEI